MDGYCSAIPVARGHRTQPREQGGFLPHGRTGLVMMMAIIMFSFGGLELVGITAAEADNPEQNIQKPPTR
ncbi:hypothetical protein ACNKHO_00860 [Shigella flexneri]